MEELVKRITEETGIPEAQAQQAAEVAINFLKEKLPAPIAGQVDAALSNEQMLDQAENAIKKGLGGLLGNK